MFSRVVHRCAKALDRAVYAITLARLTVLDWLAGPMPETPADRLRAEEAGRSRQALSPVNLGDGADVQQSWPDR